VKPIEYTIRRATPSDAERIAEAHADSIRSIGPRFYPAATVDAWASGLTKDLYISAMESGEVFWIAGGEPGGGHEVLGFSSHRIDVAEAAARRAGATTIEIAASLAALEFYKAHDFEEVGPGEHRLESGRPMPCIFMRKILKPPPGRLALQLTRGTTFVNLWQSLRTSPPPRPHLETMGGGRP
jgi:hypothetical protein